MYSNMILNYVEAAASGPIYESEVSMGIERVNNALIPYVIEQSPRGERSYDIHIAAIQIHHQQAPWH